jgi:uncharacterized repeat protein (TIGR03803 family)
MTTYSSQRLVSIIFSTGFAVALVLGFALAAGTPARAQTLTVLYTFTGGTDGGLANSGLIHDAAGSLYGTTAFGGDANCAANFNPPGCGIVFKYNKSGLTVLYTFTGTPDGEEPNGLLLLAGGNLYGTTSYGGLTSTGTVYELTTSGQKIAEYSFQAGKDAAQPFTGVARNSKGDLFGTGYFGGANGDGAVFELNFNSQGVGKESVLHSFTGRSDGANPNSTPALVSGAVIGTTTYGGGGSCNNGFAPGCGVVYQISASGESVLHSFSGPDGSYPDFLLPVAGNFYGLTAQGGGADVGTLFQMSAGGTVTTLYSFPGGNSAGDPGGLVEDSQGNFFGTTYIYGADNAGVIYELSPNGQGAYNETVLYTFTGGADGNGPQPGLVLDENTHTIYGVTITGGDLACNSGNGCGTLWKLAY